MLTTLELGFKPLVVPGIWPELLFVVPVVWPKSVLVAPVGVVQTRRLPMPEQVIVDASGPVPTLVQMRASGVQALNPDAWPPQAQLPKPPQFWAVERCISCDRPPTLLPVPEPVGAAVTSP